MFNTFFHTKPRERFCSIHTSDKPAELLFASCSIWSDFSPAGAKHLMVVFQWCLKPKTRLAIAPHHLEAAKTALAQERPRKSVVLYGESLI